jgi:hypothetical protein
VLSLLHGSLSADCIDSGVYEAFMYWKPNLKIGNVEPRHRIFAKGDSMAMKDVAGNEVQRNVGEKRINELDIEMVRGLVARWNTDQALGLRREWMLKACSFCYPDMCGGLFGTVCGVRRLCERSFFLYVLLCLATNVICRPCYRRGSNAVLHF